MPAHQVCKRRLMTSHSEDNLSAVQESGAMSKTASELSSMAKASSKTVTEVVRWFSVRRESCT